MDRIKVSIERTPKSDIKQFFVTPWFDGNLEIVVNKVGRIVDTGSGQVVGEFRVKPFIIKGE